MNIKLRFQALAITVLMFGTINVFSQETRYSSDKYKVAFKIPKDFVKSKDSTEKKISYDYLNTSGEILGTLQFMILGDMPADVATALSDYNDAAEKAFIDGYINGFNKELAGAKAIFLEKKRFKVSDINAYRFTISAAIYGIKIRGASFVLPVTTQKRIYCFNVVAKDENFDKFLSEAEPAVNSFELLKNDR